MQMLSHNCTAPCSCERAFACRAFVGKDWVAASMYVYDSWQVVKKLNHASLDSCPAWKGGCSFQLQMMMYCICGLLLFRGCLSTAPLKRLCAGALHAVQSAAFPALQQGPIRPRTNVLCQQQGTKLAWKLQLSFSLQEGLCLSAVFFAPKRSAAKVHARLLGAMHKVCHSSLIHASANCGLMACDAAVALATPLVS